MTTGEIFIRGRRIAAGEPAYLVAEMSANHGGRLERAVELVHAAKRAGADAIKLQTYTPDTVTLDCDSELFRVGEGSLWAGRTLHDLYVEAHTPWEWQPELFALAGDLDLDCFSSPFDDTAVDFLEEIGVPAYKIASFELVDLPLIARVAATGKPLILSTGLATLAEIEEAVETFRAAGGRELALLHCTSAYPAPPESMHLGTIPHLAETFGVPVGLSDHTLGVEVPIAAVALGACLIEKHLTLSRQVPGPDSSFSLEPDEFGAMVEAVRKVEKALGAARDGVGEAEVENRVFRRSLFVVEDIAAGEELTRANVRSIRPGHGLHPRHFEEILGRRAARDVRRGTPLSWELIAGG